MRFTLIVKVYLYKFSEFTSEMHLLNKFSLHFSLLGLAFCFRINKLDSFQM